MPFSRAPYGTDTINLMTAALDAAWIAARLEVPGLSALDRADMARAIRDAVAGGERDFKRLQQTALQALARGHQI